MRLEDAGRSGRTFDGVVLWVGRPRVDAVVDVSEVWLVRRPWFLGGKPRRHLDPDRKRVRVWPPETFQGPVDD